MYDVLKLNFFPDSPIRHNGNSVNLREFMIMTNYCIIELVLSNAVFA